MHANAFLETLGQDVRYALRGFRRTPGFTLTAILALTLGIGATTAVFSAVDRILFRSLPYPEEKRLVSLGMMAPLDTNEFVLAADWMDWRAANTPFESMTTFTPGNNACDLTDENPARFRCVLVEATFLRTFGIKPIIGRDFTSDDDRPNAPRVALISYGLWQGRFAGDVRVVGQTMPLDGRSVTIHGVLPPNFEMPNLFRADVLIPQALDPARLMHPNSGGPLRAFGRLKPGVTIPQAQDAMQPLFQESLQWVPPAFRNEVKLRIRSVRDRQVQDVRLASWVLLGSVLAVLLIACANVANLLLARAATRQREFAVRAAIGAGRGRLMRQTLTESLMLGLFGGAGGCALAWMLLRTIVRIAPSGIPRLEEASLDIRVLLFALAATIVSGLIFGLIPAVQTPSPETLVGRGVAGTRGLFRHSLVAAQIAISLVLLTGAGLLVRSLWNLQNVPLGMRTERVITAPIVLGQQRYGLPRQQQVFFEELESRLRNISGLGDVAISDSVPLGGSVSDVVAQGGTQSMLYANIEIEGRPRTPESTGGLVAWRRVTPEYFRVLGIPILRGRAFTESDRNADQHAVIISDSLAHRLFPSEEAIGRQMRYGFQGPWRAIIGVAANVKNNPGLADADDPEYYVPRKHNSDEGASRQASIILRTSLEPKAVSDAVRAAVSAIDATLPVAVQTMERRVSELADRPRFNTALLAVFAAIGVLLAAIGLYGVISFLVTQRTQEIGVRVALGARSRSIICLVLSHAMRWTVAGAIVGVFGSLATTRFLRGLLFRVPERDPWILSLTISVLVVVAFAAAWLPAHRAARVDPVIALRQD